MIDHDRALELAASSLDFELSHADADALTAHLESCDACRAIDEGLRSDAVALTELGREDAPSVLRERILRAASGAEGSELAPFPSPGRARPTLLRLPDRLRDRAVLVAAAAVIVAVVGGTLAWRAIPSDGGIAILGPSPIPSIGPDRSGPPSSAQPRPTGICCS